MSHHSSLDSNQWQKRLNYYNSIAPTLFSVVDRTWTRMHTNNFVIRTIWWWNDLLQWNQWFSLICHILLTAIINDYINENQRSPPTHSRSTHSLIWVITHHVYSFIRLPLNHLPPTHTSVNHTMMVTIPYHPLPIPLWSWTLSIESYILY